MSDGEGDSQVELGTYGQATPKLPDGVIEAMYNSETCPHCGSTGLLEYMDDRDIMPSSYQREFQCTKCKSTVGYWGEVSWTEVEVNAKPLADAKILSITSFNYNLKQWLDRLFFYSESWSDHYQDSSDYVSLHGDPFIDGATFVRFMNAHHPTSNNKVKELDAVYWETGMERFTKHRPNGCLWLPHYIDTILWVAQECGASIPTSLVTDWLWEYTAGSGLIEVGDEEDLAIMQENVLPVIEHIYRREEAFARSVSHWDIERIVEYLKPIKNIKDELNKLIAVAADSVADVTARGEE